MNIPFERLHITKQRRTPPSKFHMMALGYDTETVDGRAHLLACKDAHIHPESFEDIATFLTRKSAREYAGFFYNMRYDFQAIIKWLPPDYWRELWTTGKTHKSGFDIELIPGKMFCLKRSTKRPFKFYDISQFYGRMKLDDAAKKFLGKTKTKHEFDLAHTTIEMMHDPLMVEYCRYDAYLCEELAWYWLQLCWDRGLYPNNLCSAASLSARYFMTVSHIPKPVNKFLNKKNKPKLKYVWEATKGAYISVFKRGYFDQVYSYDINSAYPYQMTRLPDLDRGVFVYRQGNVPEGAVMGWLRAHIYMPGRTYREGEEHNYPLYYMNPIITHTKGTWPNMHFAGELLQQYITLMEYRWLLAHGIEVKPTAGLYWMPDGPIHYPFQKPVEELYAKRLVSKSEEERHFLKIVMNGFYGKNLEKHPVLDPSSEYAGKVQTGNYFNPMYASYILAGARLQVQELLMKAGPENVIACFTDSVITREPLPIKSCKDLGAWSPDKSGECLMIGAGVYTIRDEKKVVSKTRGLRTTDKVDLIEVCREQAHRNVLTLPITQNISMAVSLIRHREGDMNVIAQDYKDIDINFDRSRIWPPKAFEIAGDLLHKWVDSEPWPYDHWRKATAPRIKKGR